MCINHGIETDIENGDLVVRPNSRGNQINRLAHLVSTVMDGARLIVGNEANVESGDATLHFTVAVGGQIDPVTLHELVHLFHAFLERSGRHLLSGRYYNERVRLDNYGRRMGHDELAAWALEVRIRTFLLNRNPSYLHQPPALQMADIGTAANDALLLCRRTQERMAGIQQILSNEGSLHVRTRRRSEHRNSNDDTRVVEIEVKLGEGRSEFFEFPIPTQAQSLMEALAHERNNWFGGDYQEHLIRERDLTNAVMRHFLPQLTNRVSRLRELTESLSREFEEIDLLASSNRPQDLVRAIRERHAIQNEADLISFWRVSARVRAENAPKTILRAGRPEGSRRIQQRLSGREIPAFSTSCR